MPNWTTVVRTGLDEGRAYNLLGINLTESPQGPGNRMVGSYDLDFRWTTAGGYIAGLTDITNSTPDFGGELTTSELSVIIADGRDMMPKLAEEDTETDLVDQDEPTASGQDVHYDGVVITGRPCTLTGVKANILLRNCMHRDAGVWECGMVADAGGGEDGFTNAVITAHDMQFDTWCDIQAQYAEELDQEIDVWTQYGQHYRYTLHYAIYVVKLMPPPGGEAQSDDIAQASDLAGSQTGPSEVLGQPTPNQTWVPVEGPAGILQNHGLQDIADSTNPQEWPEAVWVRLWNSEPPGHRCLKRGRVVLPYSVPGFPNHAFVGFGIDFSAEEDPREVHGEQDGPSVEARGKLVQLRITWTGEHRLQADEMVVLHVQTGRAALAAPAPGVVLTEPAKVIGGPSTQLPVCGPIFSLTHWNIQARSRTT